LHNEQLVAMPNKGDTITCQAIDVSAEIIHTFAALPRAILIEISEYRLADIDLLRSIKGNHVQLPMRN